LNPDGKKRPVWDMLLFCSGKEQWQNHVIYPLMILLSIPTFSPNILLVKAKTQMSIGHSSMISSQEKQVIIGNSNIMYNIWNGFLILRGVSMQFEDNITFSFLYVFSAQRNVSLPIFTPPLKFTQFCGIVFSFPSLESRSDDVVTELMITSSCKSSLKANNGESNSLSNEVMI
jgi:hypothetical protein